MVGDGVVGLVLGGRLWWLAPVALVPAAFVPERLLAFTGRSVVAAARVRLVATVGVVLAVAAAVAVVFVQAGFADLDQSECLVDIITNDLVGEAQTCECLRQTQDTEQCTWRCVCESLLASLITLLLLAQANVGSDKVV